MITHSFIHSFIYLFIPLCVCVYVCTHTIAQILTNKTQHFRAEAKSKIDCSDPNPAHKLQRSINDLSITGARKLNPRFNPDLTKETLQTRRNILWEKSSDSSNSAPTKSATFPRSVKVPQPVAENLSTDETSSSSSVVAEEIEAGRDDNFTLNGQTDDSNHDTDGVVDSDGFDQDTCNSGGRCATILPEAQSADSQPKTNVIISEPEKLPNNTFVSSKETPTTDIFTFESAAAAITILAHHEKEDDASSVDDHDGTGSENDACELVEMDDTVVGVTRELLPPQIVVYDEDETVIETIDADTIVQVEKTQARTVMESSVHMYGSHREQQDGDEQNRISRL